MLRTVLWLVAIALGLFGALCTVGNIRIVVRRFVKKNGGSLAPLFGGLAGCLACAIEPTHTLRRWCWLPWLVDPGSVFLLAAMAKHLLQRRRD